MALTKNKTYYSLFTCNEKKNYIYSSKILTKIVN